MNNIKEYIPIANLPEHTDGLFNSQSVQWLNKDHIFVITDEIEPKSTRNVSEISLKNSSEIQTLPDQTDTSFEAILNTCEQNYDISKQDKKIPRDSLYRDIDTNRGNSLFDIDEYF